MTATAVCWNELVAIRQRYQRSVHLERDFGSPAALNGYLVTPLVRAVVGRVGEGLASETGNRAWSITGPYGSGKSALALFLAKLLSFPNNNKERDAWSLLAEQDSQLGERLKRSRYFRLNGGLCPVLATGERRAIEQTLLLALDRAVQRFWSGRGARPEVLRRANRMARRSQSGEALPARDVVALFEEVAEKVGSSQARGSGLLVILDETGKTLEYAAQAPERGDIHLLQELAEAAHRSGERPLIFITLLHQAFDQYAGRLNSAQRREWAKVHGRFEDVAFQEGAAEVLRLIASAIDYRGEHKRGPKALRDVARAAAASVASLASPGVFRDRRALEELLVDAIPLHPVTTLLLGPLFRSELAQNERSLFAFLSSGEPRGFQEFLEVAKATSNASCFYSVDRLYDYILAAYGGRLSGHQGRQIAAVEDAIRRLPEAAGDLDVRLLKAIGLLGTLGDATGLAASEDILFAALGDTDRASRAEIRRSLDRLKTGSFVVYRKYRDAYQVWEGSDLDLEALVRAASRQIDPQTGLLARLNRVMLPRPILARRHLMQTGTLRYYTVRYTDESILDGVAASDSGGADGYAWVILPSDASSASRLGERVAHHGNCAPRAKPIIIGVATHPGRIREVGLDVAALEWVQSHTPELQTDRIAQRELAARLADAERRLKGEADRLFCDEAACHWYFRGQRIPVRRPHDLTRTVSEICDQVYSKAPMIHNELLNRPSLSSAAAAARKALLRAMVESGAKPKLGFEGFPPEYAMYRSLLEEHGLHREEDGRWGFCEPVERRNGSLRPVWQVVERALSKSDGNRINVATLYHELRNPPYGVKDGLLPVLLTALMLQLEAELALYEEGTFLPALSLAVIERLLRSPERFELQRFQIHGARADFLDRLAGSALARPNSEQKLLPVVRQLVRLVRQLPDFSRNTRRVSASAQAVREALLRAREPGPLVFRELPIALGLAPIEPRLTEDAVGQLLDRLKAALRELQVAYAHLLDAVERSLGDSFGLRSSGRMLRNALQARATALLPLAVEADLKAFLLRVTDERLEREEWLASASTVLAGKPPEAWHDVDFERAQIRLALYAQQANSLEALLLGARGSVTAPGARLVRISIVETGQPEHTRVLAVEEDREEELHRLCARILEAVGERSGDEDVLAALAMLSQELLKRRTHGSKASATEVET
jgi:hypothetical protein